MLHLTMPVWTAGSASADFSRYAKHAQAQQNYAQGIGALWMNTIARNGLEAPPRAKRIDKRFATDDWERSVTHDFLEKVVPYQRALRQ